MKTENIYLKICNKQALVSVSFNGPNLFFILYIYIYIYLQRTISCKNTHTPTVQKGRGYKWTVDTEFMVITFISKHLYQERERELGGPNRNSTTLPWKLKSWNTCSLSWLSVPTDKVRIFFGGVHDRIKLGLRGSSMTLHVVLEYTKVHTKIQYLWKKKYLTVKVSNHCLSFFETQTHWTWRDRGIKVYNFIFSTF